jgi:hypothetical protein
LWHRDPADCGRAEVIVPAHLRHGRAGCALLPPIRDVWLAQQLTPTFRRAVNLLETNFYHVFDVPPIACV